LSTWYLWEQSEHVLHIRVIRAVPEGTTGSGGSVVVVAGRGAQT